MSNINVNNGRTGLDGNSILGPISVFDIDAYVCLPSPLSPLPISPPHLLSLHQNIHLKLLPFSVRLPDLPTLQQQIPLQLQSPHRLLPHRLHHQRRHPRQQRRRRRPLHRRHLPRRQPMVPNHHRGRRIPLRRRRTMESAPRPLRGFDLPRLLQRPLPLRHNPTIQLWKRQLAIRADHERRHRLRRLIR